MLSCSLHQISAATLIKVQVELCGNSLIRHWYLNAIRQGLQLSLNTKDEIGLGAQNIDTILGSVVNKIQRAYVIILGLELLHLNPNSELQLTVLA